MKIDLLSYFVQFWKLLLIYLFILLDSSLESTAPKIYI